MKTSARSRWPIVLAGCVLVILPACGSEGEGSIHLGRTPTSKVMIVPDRKPAWSSQVRRRTGPITPKLSSPKH
jgi:hypothetical protein